jgi:hypothetical protein
MGNPFCQPSSTYGLSPAFEEEEVEMATPSPGHLAGSHSRRTLEKLTRQASGAPMLATNSRERNNLEWPQWPRPNKRHMVRSTEPAPISVVKFVSSLASMTKPRVAGVCHGPKGCDHGLEAEVDDLIVAQATGPVLCCAVSSLTGQSDISFVPFGEGRRQPARVGGQVCDSIEESGARCLKCDYWMLRVDINML